MSKERNVDLVPIGDKWRKMCFMMKLSVLFLFVFLTNVTASSVAQGTVTLTGEQLSVKEIFAEIRRQTGYTVVYNNERLNQERRLSVNFENVGIEVVLEEVLRGTGLSYELMDDFIILRKIKQEAVDTLKARSFLVKGFVQDKSKLPLPGVAVQLKGTKIGVATDINGAFSIMVPDTLKSELIFSFIGMKTITLKCAARPKKGEWVITMEDEVLEMDEVNVVSTGYGDVDRRGLTSAVTPLKMEDIMVPGLNSVDQMLEGRIPGMIFMQNSGQVGATPRVRIRGNSTVIGNQEPLWVVDGVVQSDPVNVDPAQLNDLDFVNLLGNAISGLNPEDIERIDVLKDAAATAIYGTRAANGVIVITTKKGKVGPPSVTYSFTGTFSRRPYYTDKTVNMMNSKERVEVSRELFERQIGFENVSVFVGYEKAVLDYNAGRISFEEFQRLTDYYETINTDWFDILCQNSFSNKHTLSLSGGSQDIRYYASVGYNDQQGVIKREEDKQLTANMKLNGTFKKLQFQFNMNFNSTKKKYTPSVDGVSVTQYAYETSRALPAYNLDGSYAFYQKGELAADKELMFNMENEMDKTYQHIKGHSISMTGDVKYRLFDVLTIQGTASYSASNTNQDEIYEEGSYYIDKLRNYPNECPLGGEWNNTNTRMTSWLGRLQLNYRQEFGLNYEHRVNVSLGGEISSKEYNTVKMIERGYYPDRGKTFGTISADDLKNKSEYNYFLKWLANNKPTISETLTNLGSLYFSATYVYNELYTFNFNTRMDASNQFGSRSREKLLPIWSVSGRWDIGNQFWKDNVNVNELALKLSYGHQGNMIDGQTSKMIITKGSRDDYFNKFVSTVKEFPNPDLKWETTASYNAEIVFSLLRNKISGSIGYYYKKTEDAFLTKTVSSINGREDYTVNKGTLENQGVELTMSFMPFNQQVSANGKRGFVWRFDPQIGQVVNNLISKAINDQNNVMRDEVTYKDFLNGNVQIAGEPLNTFYSYQFTGLSSKDGSPTFYGTERERADELKEKYNKMSNEEVILEVMESSGTRVPVLQGGFSNYLGYRQFGLSFNFTYSLGNKIRMLKICDDYNIRPYPAVNLRREFVDRWRRPGDEKKTNIPGLVVSDVVNNDNWWNWGNELFAFAGKGDSYYSMYDYSDIRVIKGDYLKLQSIALRYNMNDDVCQKLGIKSAYISLSGANLFTLQNKKAKGMDVTSQSGSASTINLSVRPTYSLTLNVTF